MKHSIRIFFFAFLAALLLAQRPWQELTLPALSDVASRFKTPPREYGAIHWAIWGGELTRERIVREFDTLAANGVYVVNFGPSQRMNPKYLSPEHLALTKFAVEEAAKRGMKVWLADEGSYPSGFAGGRINEEYPQLRMQGIVADIRIGVAPGQTLSMPAPPDTLGAFFLDPATGAPRTVPVLDGMLKWIPPAATTNGPPRPIDLVVIRRVFRSSPTRYINRADGTTAKDALYSLIDYLDPNATRAFLKTTHEVYKGLFGNEFGKTVLGFFGDEPDYTGFIPWTPQLLDQFRRQKGYDLQPELPLLFAPKMTPEAWRVKADYYDVWSGMFRDSFFGVQAEWCKQNNLEYLVHLNHEEIMLNSASPEDLIRNEGDYFRDNRYVQVPGIDNLTQLVPGAVHTPDGTWNVNNNFPKLASSAAHLFGKPKVWSEEGGGLGIDGKYQLDYQLVRGVNALQIRIPIGGGNGNAAAPPMPPQAAMLAWYTNRAGYLMAIGRPAAQVALYHPANSMWMGDEDADRSTTKLGWQLFEHQVDWDYFDEQSLSSVATLEDGGFKNLSGQVYKAIVIPASTVITRTALDRLRAFVKIGGKVVFVGKTPTLIVDQSFRDAKDTPDLSFATLIEPSGDITPRVIAALPAPDVKLNAAFSRLTYTHRSWRDSEMYYFFNESDREESRTVTIAGRGQAQAWDLGTGEIHAISGTTGGNGSVTLPLVLEPYEARVVVVGPLPGGVSPAEPPWSAGNILAELGDDWTVDLNGKVLTTPLKSWEALGTPAFSGPATYRRQFNIATAPTGKRLFIEIADVHEYARLKVNGKELEAHAWQPYRWEVTSLVKPGTNELEVEVRATAVGGRGGGRGNVPAGTSGLLGPVRLVAR